MGKIINIQDYLNIKKQKITNQEERDFIKLLRYFVEIQEPRVDTVIINLLDGFKFELLEPNGSKINLNQFDCISEMKNIDFNDLLISSLVTLNPLKIILKQNNKNQLDLIRLKEVFDNVEMINQ